MLCDFCDFTLKHCINIVTVGVKGIKGIIYASEQWGLSFRIDSRSMLNVGITSPNHRMSKKGNWYMTAMRRKQQQQEVQKDRKSTR